MPWVNAFAFLINLYPALCILNYLRQWRCGVATQAILTILFIWVRPLLSNEFQSITLSNYTS